MNGLEDLALDLLVLVHIVRPLSFVVVFWRAFVSHLLVSRTVRFVIYRVARGAAEVAPEG